MATNSPQCGGNVFRSLLHFTKHARIVKGGRRAWQTKGAAHPT